MMTVARRVVLLVDSHSDSRDVYRAVLERRGYTVLEADDASSGWDQARLVRPDLVVTEVSMRGRPFELLERLKSEPESKDVPVLVLTTQGFAETRAQAEAAGCARFLVKPLEPRELMKVVESVIGPSGIADEQ